MTRIKYIPDSEEGRRFLWVGKNRKISFSKASELNGEVTQKEISSSFLADNRKLTLYCPKELNEKTSIIYMTDGSEVEHYSAYVDKMITDEMIIPIKLVGVHSSQINRYKEYVHSGIDIDIFERHENFFYNEVLTETKGNIKDWQGKRYIYGFSNGAAFCMHAGINHPDKFEEVIAFSTAGYISEFIRFVKFKHQNYPSFYMGAGRYEESIFRDNRKFVPKLKKKNIDVEFREFVSGHNYNVWKLEFLESRFKK